MPVKYAYLYCVSNNIINNLLKIGIVSVAVNDKRRLGVILEEVMGETWEFVMAKFIHHPEDLGTTLQNILKKHYPVVERNIFNMPIEDADMYFNLIRGENVQLAHSNRRGY